MLETASLAPNFIIQRRNFQFEMFYHATLKRRRSETFHVAGQGDTSEG